MPFSRYSILRKLVTKLGSPMNEKKAIIWTQRLSFLYLFLGWNALGLMFYKVFKEDFDMATYESPEAWAKANNLKNVRFYRIKGFQVVEKKILNKHPPDEEIEN